MSSTHIHHGGALDRVHSTSRTGRFRPRSATIFIAIVMGKEIGDAFRPHISNAICSRSRHDDGISEYSTIIVESTL